MRKILIVGAHPDDEILGVGGTLAKHAAQGDEVYACLLCEHVNARANKPEHTRFLEQVHAAKNIIGIKEILFFDFPNIAMNTVPTLKIVQAIEEAIVRFKPEVVYTHHVGDVNDDHHVVFRATMAAIRLPERGNIPGLPRNLIKEVLSYETPSSTEWAAPLPAHAFLPNVFVNIRDFLDKKLQALSCYENVTKSYPHPRSVEAMRAKAKTTGVQAGLEAAEAFMLMRGLRI